MYAQPLLRMRSGVLVHATNPDPATLNILDIAFALSRRMRYSSQSDISVAQHSCMGAQWFLDRGHERNAYSFLMHDSAEYLTGDIATPFKHSERMAGFRSIERHVEQLLANKFRFEYPLNPAVKLLDQQLLATEARAIGLDVMLSADAPGTIKLEVEPWRTEDARSIFLSLFNHLAPREFHVPHAATIAREDTLR